MKHKNKTGVTLIEMLIGFIIIGFVSVIFLKTMHTFRKETTFTTENFLALTLSEKVLEKCYQETELNPYGMETIGVADPNGKNYSFSTYITDKETIFFSKPAITKKTAPNLYSMLKDNFNLNITSEKKDGYYELSAGFKWKAKTGQGKAFSSTRILSFTGEKEVLTTFSLSENEVKQKIAEDIYGNKGANIEAQLGISGAYELVTSIGHIFYSCKEYLNSKEFNQKLQQVKSLKRFYQANSKNFQKCTQMYFEISRDLLHLMLSLKPHLSKAKEKMVFLEKLPLPEKFIIESRIEKGGLYYRQLRRIFMNSILKFQERYKQQLNCASTQRQQRRMISRLFNANRILYVNRNFSEEVNSSKIVAQTNEFLNLMKAYFKEKDPSICRLIDQEKCFISGNKLEQKYFVLRLTNELFNEIEEFSNILDQNNSQK